VARQGWSKDPLLEEVEATIFDGDTALMSSIPVLFDVLDVPAGSSDGSGWHAHAALPLGLVLEPGEQMRVETADGRSGRVAILDSPTRVA